jgi:hypothetical protein
MPSVFKSPPARARGQNGQSPVFIDLRHFALDSQIALKMHKTPYLLACAILPCSLLRRDKLLNSHQNTLASVTLLYTSFFLRLKKIRFFQKIGFLSWCRSQKNPIFSKNRIFKLVSLSKKIRSLSKFPTGGQAF